MTDGDYECPKCGSTDLASIQTEAIADELVECRSCKGLFQIVYESDGTTPRVVEV